MRNQLALMRYLLLAVLTLGFVGAGTASADRISELRQQFQQRDAELRQAKKSGKIGETYQGYVEAVSGDVDTNTRKLMDSENADRRELYKLIAEKDGTTADKVAERNATRNFDRATSGEMLKYADGWKKKA